MTGSFMIDSQLDRLALDSWPIDYSSSSGPLPLAVDLTGSKNLITSNTEPCCKIPHLDSTHWLQPDREPQSQRPDSESQEQGYNTTLLACVTALNTHARGVICVFVSLVVLISPRRMREGYGSRSFCLSVCLSVCYHASCYIPRF